MKVAAAKLSPLLKSDVQGLILAELFMNPDEFFAISHLADFAGTSLPTAMREVDRLLDGQLVVQKTVGRARLIQANKLHLLFDSVSQIVAFSYGPAAVLPPLLVGLDGIDHAYLFGVWAARLSRQTAATPKEVDLLLIGNVSRIEASRAATKAEEILGREVNVQFATALAWERGDTDFVKEVKANPLVELTLIP
ncbi:hypothetical protein [Rhodoluna limnophila]|uniref:hypothetical protein n=1 Tax=Rhodoluna limnophila TaxID=232537 RepID=UPI0011064DC0|nr:hypothetical protein [Rhodoluna limnophila]